MAKREKGLRQSMALQADQRLAVLGRLRMAEWIEMPEPEFAREIQRLESDPLFRKLSTGVAEDPGVVRRQRWPRSRFTNGFYDVDERLVAGGQRVRVEELLAEGPALLSRIRKMGKEAFERYFLYAEEALPLPEIARRTGLSAAEIEAVHQLLLKVGAEAEFAGPDAPTPGLRQTCLARLSVEDGETSFEFFSPYWARGLYQVRHDLLERWKGAGRLSGAELKRLPGLLKRLETLNLRQSTLFRILESLTKIQASYLASRDAARMSPISLRLLSHRLDLAPSTVSRALSGRSVLLPWGKDVPLIRLLPGRRRVVKDILARWLEEDPAQTDAALSGRLKAEHGIKVSRRTVNAARHQLDG